MALSRFKQPEILGINLYPLQMDIPVSKPTTIDLVGGICCHICQMTLPNKKDYDRHYFNHTSALKNVVYTCVVCMKPFFDYSVFRNHCYNLHVTKNKFKCEHCGKSYSKQSILLDHVKVEHNLQCKICNERFTSKEDLQLHKIRHRSNQHSYTCSACGDKIFSAEVCEMHIDEVATITFPCPICDDVLKSKADVLKHIDKHFKETITEQFDNVAKLEKCNFSDDSSVDAVGILCCHCHIIFKNRTDIELHFNDEHSDVPLVFTCNICHKTFDKDKYHNFLNHCYVHLTKNKFRCTECDKTFPRLSLFVVHTEAFHSLPGSTECANRDEHKPFQCWCCQQNFKSQRRLVGHVRREHGNRCIQCPEDGCKSSFKSLKDLVLHQREHTNILKNSCRFCKLQFTSLTSCANHIEIHRIKNYACPICNKEYKEKYSLVKHISMHFESVLHICKVCGRTFNAKSRLTEHSKIHSEVKKFACTYCSKSFMKQISLQEHLNIHTGMRPYECVVCLKTFASRPNWKKHLRRMHDFDTRKIQIDEKEHQVDLPAKKKTKKACIEIENTKADVSMKIDSDECSMDSTDASALEKEINKNNIDTIDGGLSDLLLPIDATFIMSEPQPLKPVTYPTEIGPDFVNADVDNLNGEFISLDENTLPYINPLLTIKYERKNDDANHTNYTNIDNSIDYSVYTSIDNETKWGPPVYTSLKPNLYHDAITEANILTFIKMKSF